jgi:hypothetical protein
VPHATAPPAAPLTARRRQPLPPRLAEPPCRSPTSTPGLPRPPASRATCVPRPRRRPLLCVPTRGTARRAGRRQAQRRLPRSPRLPELSHCPTTASPPMRRSATLASGRTPLRRPVELAGRRHRLAPPPPTYSAYKEAPRAAHLPHDLRRRS